MVLPNKPFFGGANLQRAASAASGNQTIQKNTRRPDQLDFTFLSKSEQTLKDVLTYPQELGSGLSNETDYVRFIFKKYKAPFRYGNFSGAPSQSSAQYNSNVLNLLDDPELPPVMLYMPEDIQAAYGTQWGGKSFQSTTADGLRNLSSTSSPSAFAAGLTQDLFDNAAASATAIGIKALIQSLQNIGQGEGLNVNDVLSSTRSVILNPNTELLFQGFDLRTFNLQFKMVARSDGEADDIRKIIYCFKAAMLPRLDEQEGSPGPGVGLGLPQVSNQRGLIGIPDLVDIKFMHKAAPHPYLTQFKPCAITGLQVNYTPDGSYATYRDGQPVALTMNVQFSETKLVYREDVRYGGPTF